MKQYQIRTSRVVKKQPKEEHILTFNIIAVVFSMDPLSRYLLSGLRSATVGLPAATTVPGAMSSRATACLPWVSVSLENNDSVKLLNLEVPAQK